MTIQEFDTIRWGAGMRAEFQGRIYDVVNCDFEDKTIGLDIDGELIEVACKLCKIV